VRILVCVGLVLISLWLPTAPFATAKSRVLDKDTFMDMETVSNPAISPDGSHIAFARGCVDKLKDQARSNLWIVDTSGARLRELTRGSWLDSAPVWSPDGMRIASSRTATAPRRSTCRSSPPASWPS
jgi:Tol biopolymer transport system component